MPPAALICTLGPMCFLNSFTSSNVAPPLPNPVEVLIKSAPPSVTQWHSSIFSSFVKKQASMITFKMLSPHTDLRALISSVIA